MASYKVASSVNAARSTVRAAMASALGVASACKSLGCGCEIDPSQRNTEHFAERASARRARLSRGSCLWRSRYVRLARTQDLARSLRVAEFSEQLSDLMILPYSHRLESFGKQGEMYVTGGLIEFGGCSVSSFLPIRSIAFSPKRGGVLSFCECVPHMCLSMSMSGTTTLVSAYVAHVHRSTMALSNSRSHIPPAIHRSSHTPPSRHIAEHRSSIAHNVRYIAIATWEDWIVGGLKV